MKTLLAATAIAALLLSGSKAAAEDDDKGKFCEHGGVLECGHGHYPILDNIRCERSCGSIFSAPPTPVVECRPASGGHDCAIWPQGEELSYHYWTSPTLTVSHSGPTYAPAVRVECPEQGPGVLVVTVTSPYGLSSNTQVELACEPNTDQ